MHFPPLENFDALLRNLNAIDLKNTYFLMRHGFSEANETWVIVSDSVDGSMGYGLTEKGRSEVTHSIHSLDKEELKSRPCIIYTSPFLRSVETSSILEFVLKPQRYVLILEFANAILGLLNYPLLTSTRKSGRKIQKILHTRNGGLKAFMRSFRERLLFFSGPKKPMIIRISLL